MIYEKMRTKKSEKKVAVAATKSKAKKLADKLCRKCDATKKVDEFYQQNGKPLSYCKECWNASNRERYKKTHGTTEKKEKLAVFIAEMTPLVREKILNGDSNKKIAEDLDIPINKAKYRLINPIRKELKAAGVQYVVRRERKKKVEEQVVELDDQSGDDASEPESESESEPDSSEDSGVPNDNANENVVSSGFSPSVE